MKKQLIAACLALCLLVALSGCIPAKTAQANAPASRQSPVSSSSLAPSPMAGPETPAPTAPPLYAVAAKEYLSLRAEPVSSSARLKKLAPGSLVTILQELGEFALIRLEESGETGYAMRSYLTPAERYRPLESQTDLQLYRVVAEEYLTLRKQADARSEAIERLDPGTEIHLLSQEGAFSLVRTLDGLEGYVLSAYIEERADGTAARAETSPVTVSGAVYVVAAEKYLSLRKGPDTGAERIQKLSRGERVLLLGQEGKFSLIQHEATGEVGYVLSSYLLTEEAFAALPKETATPDLRYVDAQESLTLRKAPDRAAEAITSLARGTKVTVYKREGDFAMVKVDTTGQEGYVLDGYLSKEPPKAKAASNTYVVLAQEYLSLRKAASLNAETLQRLPAGSDVELLSFDGLFAKVEASGQTGYVLAGYLRPKEQSPSLSTLKTVRPTENYSPGQIEKDLLSLDKEFPQLQVRSIGTSLEGRKLYVAVLGNENADTHVLIQGGIHGREHMTSLLMMAQLEYILRNPSESYKGLRFEELLQKVCFHILPTTNPDGANISQTAKETKALRAIYESDLSLGRTELSIADYLKTWKANAGGVDLNRNFAAGWEALGGPKGPSQSHYKGASALDQPETKALVAYSLQYDFDVTISYHAYGSILYWEYGGDEGVLNESRELGKAVRAVTDYPLASSSGVDAGGYKDWAMEMRSIPSLTVEIGTGECPLPLNEFYTIWERNRLVLPAAGVWALS